MIDSPLTPLTLTFAEVAYLAAGVEEQNAARGYKLLRLNESVLKDAIRSAGLASLMVRGLAVVSEDDVTLAPVVAAVVETLFGDGPTMSVAVAARDHVESMEIIDGPNRFMARPVAMLLFEFTVLDPQVSRAQIAVDVLERSLALAGELFVSFACTGSGAERTMVLKRNEQGALTVATGDEVEQPATVAEVTALLNAVCS
jgi:hypothetical protein